MFDFIKTSQTVYQHPNFSAFFPANSTTPSILGGLHQTLDNFNSDSEHYNPEMESFENELLEAVREMMYLPENFSSAKGGLSSFQPTVGNSSLMAVNLAKKMCLDRELTKDPSLTKKSILDRMVGYFPSTSHSHCIKSLSLLDIKHNTAIPSVYC
jgi:glutamate/tyrosine decarboxylase-like PLP-dependent enzyme